MASYLPTELRQRLIEADGHHCAYCQTAESNSGQPLVPDHVIPTSKGGATVFENLCLACRRCNEFKGAMVDAVDPLTDESVPLYHPRQQDWSAHFEWDATGTQLNGLTAVGRATVVALRINNEVIVAARRRWVSVGWHPPKR